jgi:hypothetical protein
MDMEHTFFSYLNQLIERQFGEQKPQDPLSHWRRDPLAHPDIKRMTERERADLQFNPHCIARE